MPIWNRIAHDWRHPKSNLPRPDYAKIERLERELGLVEPIMPPPVLRTVEQDGGEVIEIRSWGS
ncbi:hypothetical protein [Streptomyces sp. B21-083]|uniref:hypothetical protein n=1 Tax=Streptomyces sp. B21-083 TaxID=3039410 RepID=UPI002FF353F0